MRLHVIDAQRSVLAICVLHNMAELLKDPLPEEVDIEDFARRPLPGIENQPQRPPLNPLDPPVEPEETESDAARRRAGQRKRELYLSYFLRHRT